MTFDHGCDVESNVTDGFGSAVASAKAADVVVFVGGNRNCEGGQGHGGAHCESEGHDRPDLEMPGVKRLASSLLLSSFLLSSPLSSSLLLTSTCPHRCRRRC